MVQAHEKTNEKAIAEPFEYGAFRFASSTQSDSWADGVASDVRSCVLMAH